MDYGRSVSRWVACFAFVFTSGCSDVDWNWDLTWWKKPRRVVRPSEQRQPLPADASSAASRPVNEQKPGSIDRTAERTTWADRAAPNPPALSPPGTAEPAVPSKPTRRDRSFYQLYLASTSPRAAPAAAATQPRDPGAPDRVDAESAEHPDERHQLLQAAPPGACAALLEMLYVPAGRSGGPTECYLLYENADEFQAAVQMIAALDVAPAERPPAAVGPPAAFRAGVALFLYIAERGTHVDRGLVDACEQNLAQANQSMDLPAPLRWTAGILAGRLVAEYRYDYPAAGSYCRQAERAAAPQSLEQMTALWWQADACVQQGETAEASRLYRRIVTDFESKYQDAYIVRRAKAYLARGKS